MDDDDDDDDDPFDFKLGVDALRAKTESKLATALENARVVDDADADDAPNNGNVVELSSESSSRLFVGAKEKRRTAKKRAQNRMPTTIETRRGRETNDDAAQATIESFSTETKVITHDVGENAGTLEALEISCLEKREGSGADGTRVARIHRQSNEERKR